MKYYLSILITCLSASLCYGQLNLVTQQPITTDTASVCSFLKNNRLDYALVAWHSSNWESFDQSFFCLIRQAKQWYLVTLKSPEMEVSRVTGIKKLSNLKTSQVVLTKRQIDSITRALKPDSGFRYTQADLNRLPSVGTYFKDGEKQEYSIVDADVYHLIRYDHGKVTYLTYYAPADFLQDVYPYNPIYGILKGFVNTTDGLAKVTKNFKLW